MYFVVLFVSFVLYVCRPVRYFVMVLCMGFVMSFFMSLVNVFMCVVVSIVRSYCLSVSS